MRYLFFLAVSITAFSTIPLKAQSYVDSGISVHNYKHHNKAEKAKAGKNERSGIIEVTSTRMKQGIITNTTPKYAIQPANLVIKKNQKKENNAVNPLTSSRNYKTSGNSMRKRVD